MFETMRMKSFIDSVGSQGPEFENASLFSPFSSFIVPQISMCSCEWPGRLKMSCHGFS